MKKFILLLILPFLSFGQSTVCECIDLAISKYNDIEKDLMTDDFYEKKYETQELKCEKLYEKLYEDIGEDLLFEKASNCPSWNEFMEITEKMLKNIDSSGEQRDGLTVIGSQSEALFGYNGTKSDTARMYFNMSTENEKNDIVMAITYLELAIEEDPLYVEAYDNLARLYRVAEKYEEAINYYKKSLEIYPEGPYAHINLAVVYSFLGEYEKTEELYRKCTEYHPFWAEGHYGLARCLMFAGKLESALYTAEKALELYLENPPNYIGDAFWLVGEILYYLGVDDDATQYLKEAILLYDMNGLVGIDSQREAILKDLNIDYNK